jgi:hypothetical protein
LAVSVQRWRIPELRAKQKTERFYSPSGACQTLLGENALVFNGEAVTQESL